MHIVIDAHLAVKRIDGIARYLIGLLTHLPKIDKTIEYTILDLPRPKSALPDTIFEESNVNRRELNLMGPSPLQHLFMGNWVRRLGADLYHHPQYDLPVGIGVPTVITIHDLKHIFHPSFLSGKSRLKRFYIKQSLSHAVRACNQAIAVSQNTLRDMIRNRGDAADKTTVIYHGVDEVGAVPALNGTLGKRLSKPFILFVGTRRPHKNIEGLIKMLAILRERKDVDVDLVIAGKGYSDYDQPERLTAEISMQDHVHFLDFVPDNELLSLYGAARFVALPSFYEGFGLPVLEAMAHGKPVLGANVTSIPEILGEAGLLANPHDVEDLADKAFQLLSSESLVKELSEKARERSKTFSWRRMAKATLEVYQHAVMTSK